MIKEVTYKSKDNKTDIHAVMWIPDREVKATLQISHGMIEHILRYKTFAEEMNKEGILVFGNDHLGHGESIVDKNRHGYFAEANSADILIEDLHTLNVKVRKKYSDVPNYILGHSMGSFIIRNYIAKYGNELNGAIIVGTGNQSKNTIKIAKFANKIIMMTKGEDHRSKFMANQTIDGFCKHFDKDNKISWLCTNPDTLKSYVDDPKTFFKFTCNGYDTLFDLILNAKKADKLIPNTLSILIISGKEDVVSNFGKDIINLYNEYKRIGIKDIEYKLYDNMRHEILNEKEKEIVYKDIINFIK